MFGSTNCHKTECIILYLYVGMLLEMDPAALQQLLSDHTTLEVAVQKAQAALDTPNRASSLPTEENDTAQNNNYFNELR